MKNPPATDTQVVPLAAVTRSGRVESTHRGSVVVVGVDGEPLLARGPVDRVEYTRSAIKPMQALPLLERGLAARAGLADGELAVLCASHNGTDAHVAAVRSLMAKLGVDEGWLQCGPHAPFDKRASIAIARAGGKPERIHNNCSGKHTGFLALARDLGVDAADYLDPDSASQRLVREVVAELAGADTVAVGVDGCGAPTLGVPLVGLARAFCRFANPEPLAAVRGDACRRLLSAFASEPALVAGEGRLCTALLSNTPGPLLVKNGAEGVYALGVAAAHGRPGFGLAIKVDDGQERGYVPVVVDLLRRFAVWDDVPQALADFHRVPVRNTQKRRVGEVTSILEA